MNEHDIQERGLFKQLVLIMFLVWAWCGEKKDRLLNSEAFWWALVGFFVVVGAYLLATIL